MNQKIPHPPSLMIFTASSVQVPVLALLDNRPLMTRERGNIKPNYPNVANSQMGLIVFCICNSFNGRVIQQLLNHYNMSFPTTFFPVYLDKGLRLLILTREARLDTPERAPLDA